MRRHRRGAQLAAAAALAALAAPRAARADEPRAIRVDLSVEAGTELDTNPRRESSTTIAADHVPAAVGRGGLRFALAFRPAPRRALRLAAVAAAKKFVSLDGTGDAAGEDVAIFAADARFDAVLASRPLMLSARLAYYDAFERDDPVLPDRDFRTGDATVMLTIRGDADQRVTASAGVRAFAYKPDGRYDFVAEHAGLRYSRPFVRGGDDDDLPGETTWDLAVEVEAHRRAYDDVARVNTCGPGAQLDAGCIAGTAIPRVDAAYQAAAEVTYTGTRIFGLRYALVVNLSNSFGQSLVRHRVELSMTTETWLSVFLTARAAVQVNQFLDPLLLDRDIGLLTIEDENRNSFTLHFTRELGGSALVAEARYSFYTNEFATQELSFRRHTAYGGLVYKF